MDEVEGPIKRPNISKDKSTFGSFENNSYKFNQNDLESSSYNLLLVSEKFSLVIFF